mgnify:CR=1 FL=1
MQFLLMLILLAACHPINTDKNGQVNDNKSPTFVPSATVWVTIAPDNIPTAIPTPTAMPLRYKPQGRIAFQSERDGNLEIYVVNADGTFLSRLTNNPAVDVFPSWSPDGEQIVFASDRDGNPEIYTIKADGSNIRRITSSYGDDALPAWSPGGKKIAFVSNRDGDDEIYVMDADGKNQKQLTDNTWTDLFPAWSPDGEHIAFVSNKDVNLEIYMMTDDGHELQRLTDNPADDSYPAWSPDGSRIAFVSNRSEFAEVYVLDISSGTVIKITELNAISEIPTWSSDARQVAFASNFEGNRDIYITGADGFGLKRLTEFPQVDFYPRWSPQVDFLSAEIPAPTAPAEFTCRVSEDKNYGYSAENSIKLGFDPLNENYYAEQWLPWLLGPQGQKLTTEFIEELWLEDAKIINLRVSYEGQEEPVNLYIDVSDFEQPKAPQGYTCGSQAEYSRAIATARYQ